MFIEENGKKKPYVKINILMSEHGLHGLHGLQYTVGLFSFAVHRTPPIGVPEGAYASDLVLRLAVWVAGEFIGVEEACGESRERGEAVVEQA